MSNAHAFIQAALDAGALKFGTFTLKSGRVSPYFFNAGQFQTGAQLAGLGQFYAQAILESRVDFDMLFGPAYKGIPLVSATAMALANQGRDVPYCFNRKQLKTYGDGGVTVGAPLSGKVLIVDDVITAGTAILESIQLIQGAGARVAGVVVLLDRQERGSDSPLSAIMTLQQSYGFPVMAVATLGDILSLPSMQERFKPYLAQIAAYQAEYGVTAPI